MATLLHRLGKTAFRRWPLFLAGWLSPLIAVGTVAATMSKPMTDAFSIPGIPSEKAADLQAELFPDVRRRLRPGLRQRRRRGTRGHTLDEPDVRRPAVDALVADLAALPQVPADAPLAEPGRGRPGTARADLDAARPETARLRRGKRATTPPRCPRSPTTAAPALISFDFDVETRSPTSSRPPSDALIDRMDEASDAGLTVEANGSGTSAIIELGGTVRADRHRRRADRADPDLRLAGRRRSADPHRHLRRRRSASPASPR